MTGHNERRYRFTKRTHQNQELGPFIAHEMNRCIACYRCVRYYKDYAGGTDLGVYGAHDNVYFGRVEDGVLESEFSGNLTEVCPTGVFTDKTHSERYNRKWDMQFAPSICHWLLQRLQHQPRRALRRDPPHREPLQRLGQPLLPLRPRSLRLRLRQPRRPSAPAAAGAEQAEAEPGRRPRPGRRPAEGAQGGRHRFAARQPGKQLRPARAGWRRQLLQRHQRRRARPPAPDPAGHAGRPAAGAEHPRHRGPRRGLRPRRGPDPDRRPHRPWPCASR